MASKLKPSCGNCWNVNLITCPKLVPRNDPHKKWRWCKSWKAPSADYTMLEIIVLEEKHQKKLDEGHDRF